MSLLPLPAGWDRDRVYSSNEDDWSELPDTDQELILAWRKDDLELSMAKLRATVAAHTNSVNASRVAAGLPTLEAEERVIAEEMGLTDLDMATQQDLFDVAKSNGMGAEAWGFVVFKTWGYKDEERERWDAFWRRWNDVMDRRLRDMGAVGNLRDGFSGKLLWWLVDHEDMDGKGFNEESVDSLLDRKETSSALLAPEEKAFVWGVDVNYEGDDEADGDEYPGHFKISTSVLIPELWHTLNAQSPDELYPGKGQIYGGIVGNIAEAIAR